MDIFKPNKNASTVVQRGLPKVLNQHIAEFWGFKKCIRCHSHSYITHFKFNYTECRQSFSLSKYCYTCQDAERMYELEQYIGQLPSQDSYEAYILSTHCTLPSFMTFNNIPEDFDHLDYVRVINDIVSFINRSGIPHEKMDYDSIIAEFENALLLSVNDM